MNVEELIVPAMVLIYYSPENVAERAAMRMAKRVVVAPISL